MSEFNRQGYLAQRPLLSAVVTTLAVGCIILLSGCTPESPRAFGTVERDRLTLSAPVNEVIAKVNVHEGQFVNMGDVLLSFDTRSANANVAQKLAQLQQSQAQLAEMLNGARIEEIDRAKASLAGASASVIETQQNYERTVRLFDTRVFTQADLDSARAARDTALAQQAQAKQSLAELENGSRVEQIDQAQANVAAAKAALDAAQKALSDLTLVAARDAYVDTLAWREGDRVAAGTQVLSLLARDKPYVRVYLPATALDKIKVGSEVKIWVDGRDTSVKGIVRNIRSQPAYTPFYALNERDRARLMYLTDIDFDADDDLATGMALEVELP